uniref:Uncharacterized protein n=1 Tax=Amphimedon queenslandica TaxID=400682 RepID=A0A1X7U4U1_AMPQE
MGDVRVLTNKRTDILNSTMCGFAFARPNNNEPLTVNNNSFVPETVTLANLQIWWTKHVFTPNTETLVYPYKLRSICPPPAVLTYEPVERKLRPKMCLTRHERPYLKAIYTGHSRSDGLLGDFCDRKSCNMYALFSSELLALQLMIYYDELELCNPLGTKTKVHKMELFNFLPLQKRLF